MRSSLLGAFLATALVGCATLPHNPERESARAIIPTPDPDSVKISDVVHEGLIVRWVATTNAGVYDCSLEASEKHPLCVKRGP